MADAIRFHINDRLHEVRGEPPTRTLLDWLRGPAIRLTGAKEGCAEGDCGACTIVRVAPDGAFQAVNSCILFLPMLDGCQLFTVEALAEGGKLHPVQQALVDHHGSQCGFCTPGIVMSLLALYQTPARDDAAIMDALAGNLCRCTGYRPILDAARAMGAAPDRFAGLKAQIASRLAALKRDKTFHYAHDGEEFFAPRTVEELVALKAAHPDARLVGGATDVGLWVTKLGRRLPALIHTAHVAGLKDVTPTGEGLEIGAAASWSAALPALEKLAPGLGPYLNRFASVQIRNSATVGGNIANGSPIGDGMPALMALKARLVLAGPGGRRELPLQDFFIKYQKTAIQGDEILEKIIVASLPASARFRVWKLAKRHEQDISAVACGLRVDLDGDRVTDAIFAFGGMAATPSRAPAAEAALKAAGWSAAGMEAAAKALSGDFTPISDMRASAGYRSLAAANLLRRFWLAEGEGLAEEAIHAKAG